MDSLQRRHKFDPLELDLVDRVYEVACRHIEARDLYRETPTIAEQEDDLRKLVFACVGNGRLDFDTLCDKVLARLQEALPVDAPPSRLPDVWPEKPIDKRALAS